MSIIQSFIARNSGIILVESTDHIGNFQQLSRVLLRKMIKEDKCTIDYDNYQFHYLKDDVNKLDFICLTDNMKIEVAYGYLHDLKFDFIKTISTSRIKFASSYQLQEYEDKMKEIICYYNKKPSKSIGNQEFETFIEGVKFKKVDEFFGEKINLIAVTDKEMLFNQQVNPDKKNNYLENYQKVKFAVIVLIGLVVFLILLMIFSSFIDNKSITDTDEGLSSEEIIKAPIIN